MKKIDLNKKNLQCGHRSADSGECEGGRRFLSKGLPGFVKRGIMEWAGRQTDARATA